MPRELLIAAPDHCRCSLFPAAVPERCRCISGPGTRARGAREDGTPACRAHRAPGRREETFNVWVIRESVRWGCLRIGLLAMPEMQRQFSATAAGTSEQRQSSEAAISCSRGMELLTSGSFHGMHSRWPADVKGKPGQSPGAPHP